MVEEAGFEPAAPRLRGGCSTRLSYTPIVEPAGVEPATSCMPCRRATSCAKAPGAGRMAPPGLTVLTLWS
jgi:hypothetical protein